LLTFSFKKVPAWGFFLPSFFFALDYQRKSGPGSCVPVRYAALSFASFPWADKEKKSIFAFSQKYFVILLILRKKRVYNSLFFLKVPTECTPRPIEKCNCTFSFFYGYMNWLCFGDFEIQIVNGYAPLQTIGIPIKTREGLDH
jgi:hypothetical protein